MLDHIDEALEAPFLLSLQTPLPSATQKAAFFLRDIPTEAVLSFWGSQLRDLDRLVSDSAALEDRWRILIPNSLSCAAGKIQLAAFMSLASQANLGGRALVATVPFRL